MRFTTSCFFLVHPCKYIVGVILRLLPVGVELWTCGGRTEEYKVADHYC